MKECESCPIEYAINHCDDGMWCEHEGDCHLTTSDMTAIHKAIAGKGRLALWVECNVCNGNGYILNCHARTTFCQQCGGLGSVISMLGQDQGGK